MLLTQIGYTCLEKGNSICDNKVACGIIMETEKGISAGKRAIVALVGNTER